MEGTGAAGRDDVLPRPHLSRLQIWNMCCGVFGVQIVWGLQNVNTSRIFQALGARPSQLAILWIAAPVTGLLIQPVIGHLSDRTWGRLGRRRPYLLGGALMTAVALVAMANATSLWSAALMLWVLTAAINVAMEPFRALVADTLPPQQRAAGFAMQVFFIGTGAVFSSALPWLMTHWFGVSGQGAGGLLPHSVTLSFRIGAVGLLLAVGWTVLTTGERPPAALEAEGCARQPVHRVPSAAGAILLRRSGLAWTAGGGAAALAAWAGDCPPATYLLAAIAVGFGLAQLGAVRLRRRGRSSLGLFEIVEDILHMPALLIRLAVVQFFTWFGLFTFWVYAVPAVAARHFGTIDPASASYNDAADWVGVLSAGYNGVAALIAPAMPLLATWLGRRLAHALCLSLGALGLAGFLLIDDPVLLWLSAVAIGCAWASILSLPYAMLASAVPARKMGVYMGIHNIFLVLPQLCAATTLGPVVQHLLGGNTASTMMLAAGALAFGAVTALAIPAADEEPC